jgi:hypothetical protein
MAKLIKSMLGSLSGRIGNVVASQRNGTTVISKRPGPRKKGSKSPEQRAQQARFALMMDFLRPLSNLLNRNFSRAVKGMTPFNKIFSENLAQAITGSFPNFTIDYPKVQLSRGRLIGFADAWCTSSRGKLIFNWADGSHWIDYPDALVYMAAFDPEIKNWFFWFGTVRRKAGSAILDIGVEKGKSLHTYIGLISENGNVESNTLYTGSVTVA